MSKNKLQSKYVLNIKQLEYNSLIHSLPKTWTNLTKQQPEILETDNTLMCSILIDHKYVKIDGITTKDIYTYLLDKEKTIPQPAKKDG